MESNLHLSGSFPSIKGAGRLAIVPFFFTAPTFTNGARMASPPESPGIYAKNGDGDWRLLGHCVALTGFAADAVRAEIATSLSTDDMRRFAILAPAPKPTSTQPAYTQLAAFKRAQNRRYVK